MAEATRDAIVDTILDIERSCLEADAAIAERRWRDIDAAFAAQAALTQRLAELFAAAPQNAPAEDAKVAQRVRGILAYREDQLSRLQAYRDEVGLRLNSAGKLRALSRSIGAPVTAAGFLDSRQ